MTKNSHTWQEILTQPEVWRATLEAFGANRATLQDFLERADFRRILVVGCGSTHYLAQTAAVTLNYCARIPAHALPASELWLFSKAVPASQALLLAQAQARGVGDLEAFGRGPGFGLKSLA